MSKKTAQKATFDDLINKKLQKEANQNKTIDIYISSMDRTITFKKPSDDNMLDAIDEIGDNKNNKTVVNAYKKLIYKTCDMFQDSKLHEALEVVDPFDTVDAVFDLDDITEIGDQLLDSDNIQKKYNQIKN